MKILGWVLLGWPILTVLIFVAGEDNGDWRWQKAAWSIGLMVLIVGSILGGIGLLVGFD